MTRRTLLRGAAASFPAVCMMKADTSLPSDKESILARIKSPVFPKRDFDIRKFGAQEGGRELCTEAIKKAIGACSAAGGGRVVIPQGTFLAGAIHLENNINLYISEGATLLFSTNPTDYLPVVFSRFESTECMNYSPFIYAFEKENIAVTGPGILDGQASQENWWSWTRKARGGVTRDEKGGGASDVQTLVQEMGNKDVPVEKRIFGEGHYLRPNFVQPYRCKNILLEGFTMKRSPMWELNPTLCQNVIVRNVTIDSHGPNNDGCDPDACRDVLIEKCTFSTGDDCIAIKAGRNRDGRRVGVPCENLVIRDCAMKDGHGGVSVGSEVSGGIKNVYISNCQMSSPDLQRGLRIKTNSYRGGEIDNIHFENVTIGQVAQAAVEVDFFYEEGKGGPFHPVVKNIYINHVTSQKSKYGVFLRGFENAPISGVTIANCKFDNAAQSNLFQSVESVKLENVLVNGKPLTLDDVKATSKG